MVSMTIEASGMREGTMTCRRGIAEGKENLEWQVEDGDK